MIKINKSNEIPAILSGKGKIKTQKLIENYTSDNNFFESRKTTKASEGKKPIKVFDKTIYGHKDVKEQLISDQYGKCCFCESKLLHITSGDVEHFHPKMEVRFDSTNPVSRPGYFWLAYDWQNLMLACEVCNRIFKRIDFPLINIKRKAGIGKIEKVFNTLLINPCIERPEDHITFKNEYIKAKTLKGTKSIQFLGLDRPHIRERRGEKLKAYFDSSTLSTLKELQTLNYQNEISMLLKKELEHKPISEQIEILKHISSKINSNFKPSFIPDDIEYAGMLRANFT